MMNTHVRDNLIELLPAAVSALPGSPYDGQEVLFLADATNGVIWHLRYRSASPSTFKWEFIGGPDLYAEVLTAEATSSTTYVALATAGPSITLPRAGDYDVEIGFRLTAGTTQPIMSYDIGGTGAVDADALSGAVAVNAYQNRWQRKTGLTAVTLTAKYRNSTAVSDTYALRWMKVTPVRVS